MRVFETTTELEPVDVIGRAREFFALSGTPYTAYAERTGDAHLQLRMEVGEIVVAAARDGGATRVRATASRGIHLLARFMCLVGHPAGVRETTFRRAASRRVVALALARPSSAGAEGGAAAGASGESRALEAVTGG